jgi:hypothetical protein
MSIRRIFQKIVILMQLLAATLLLIAGSILIFATGFPSTIEQLSTPIVITGFTFVGLGVAAGSFALSEVSQIEILEAIKASK